MEHDNLFIQILEILSIKHTEDFTIRYYERHPHKNNLFGLSEMLRYYNIENVAAEIQKTQENLSSLDVPFVAYVHHEFVSVRHVSPEAIIYSWRGNNITLSRYSWNDGQESSFFSNPPMNLLNRIIKSIERNTYDSG